MGKKFGTIKTGRLIQGRYIQVQLDSVFILILAAPVPVRARNGPPVDTEETRPHSKLEQKGSNNSRGSENNYTLGEGAVVQLPPPPEGGRLESDRIIMADGTAIDLFDESEDKGVREKAHRRSRERQDEVRYYKQFISRYLLITLIVLLSQVVAEI